METELSFGQTTFLLWVPPFLSYELWKLRIELWKHLVQTGPKAAKNKTKISIEYPKSDLTKKILHVSSFLFLFFWVKTTFDFEYIFFPIAAIPLHILDIPFVVNVQKYIIAIMY